MLRPVLWEFVPHTPHFTNTNVKPSHTGQAKASLRKKQNKRRRSIEELKTANNLGISLLSLRSEQFTKALPFINRNGNKPIGVTQKKLRLPAQRNLLTWRVRCPSPNCSQIYAGINKPKIIECSCGVEIDVQN